jgi:hypothetical protein
MVLELVHPVHLVNDDAAVGIRNTSRFAIAVKVG